MRLVPTGQSHTKPNYYPYNVIGFLAGHAKTPKKSNVLEGKFLKSPNNIMCTPP